MIYIHRTRDGKEIKFADLKDDHLLNIINLIRRKSIDGVMIRSGGGVDAEEIWYDEYEVFGKEVLSLMHFDKYIKEAKKRKLKIGK